MLALRLRWWATALRHPLDELLPWVAFAVTFVRLMLGQVDRPRALPAVLRELVVGWRDLTRCPQCASAVAAAHAERGEEHFVELLREWSFLLATEAGASATWAHPGRSGWCGLRRRPRQERQVTPAAVPEGA